MQLAGQSFRGALPCVCLTVCDLETSTVRRPRPEFGCSAREKKNFIFNFNIARDGTQTSNDE
jgi:hypothetical protein